MITYSDKGYVKSAEVTAIQPGSNLRLEHYPDIGQVCITVLGPRGGYKGLTIVDASDLRKTLLFTEIGSRRQEVEK